MLGRLILGLVFIGLTWAIGWAAAKTSSIFVMVTAGFSAALLSIWLPRLKFVRSSFSSEAQRAFVLLALIGSVIVVSEVAGGDIRYWFAGPLIAVYLLLLAYHFFKPEAHHERTR